MEKLKFFREVAPSQESKTNPEQARREWVAEMLELVKKMNESGESLPFPGVDPETYLKMKKTDSEYPGYTTPIDEIIERCTKEGIKVVLGTHRESGSILVLPAGSNDIEMDSISPNTLVIANVENEHLATLIQLTTKKT